MSKPLLAALPERLAQPEPIVQADVARVNKNYALIIVGDKTVIIKFGEKNEFCFLTVGAFKQWFSNQFVVHNEKRTPLGNFWLGHPQRRQYEGITFDPTRLVVTGQYNLWHGFAVEAKDGDCSKFLAHIKDNVCRGDDVLYRWVVGWFADILQHPAKKIGTSLVFRGPQGVGKTKVGEVIGSLLGPHSELVSDPRYVTGRFNSHMISCLLLHCDEGFWAGDRGAEGKLKDLVTGSTHFIEFKGKEAIRVKNYIRLFVTGNQNWLVPAGFGERRFAVIDVGEARMQDKEYFAAIDHEMDNGGREALLHHLLHYDLSTVDLRTIPKTGALMEQKMSSLDGEQAWWLDALVRGELPWGCDDNRSCATSKIFDMYVQHAGRHGIRRRSIETQLGMFLTKHVPGLRRNTRSAFNTITPHGDITRAFGSTYEFPPLQDCRSAFEAAMQQKFDWDDKEDWTLAPSPERPI